jgi:ribosome-associated heat shock protein Hsp15
VYPFDGALGPNRRARDPVNHTELPCKGAKPAGAPPGWPFSSATGYDSSSSREENVSSDAAPNALDSLRLDVWLDVACLFKTRSDAQKACKAGKIDVNQQTAKPNRLLRVGDELVIKRAFGRTQRVVVRGLTDRHRAKADARKLFDDLTPAPTPEELEARRLERVYRAAVTGPKAPDKRERRELRRLRGRDD